MSRFSKSEVEARGWVIEHEDDGYVVGDGDFRRVVAPSIRAAKYENGVKVQEIGAETTGLLLESITAYEQHRDGLPRVASSAIDEAEIPKDEAGVPIRTVLTGDGRSITEAELSGRAQKDVIVTDVGQQFLSGAELPGEPHEAVAGSLAAKDARERERETAETAQSEAHIDAEQVEYDTAGNVDSPGQSAGGVVRVPAGSSLAQVAADRADQAVRDESDRVARERDQQFNASERLSSAGNAPSEEEPPEETPSTEEQQDAAEQARLDAIQAKTVEQGSEARKQDKQFEAADAGAQAAAENEGAPPIEETD